MDVVYTYSHLGGEEILIVRHPGLNKEINDIIESIRIPGRHKYSKEKTMRGRALYSPKEINSLFKQHFYKRGWKELRDYYDIEIPNYPY